MQNNVTGIAKTCIAVLTEIFFKISRKYFTPIYKNYSNGLKYAAVKQALKTYTHKKLD